MVLLTSPVEKLDRRCRSFRMCISGIPDLRTHTGKHRRCSWRNDCNPFCFRRCLAVGLDLVPVVLRFERTVPVAARTALVERLAERQLAVVHKPLVVGRMRLDPDTAAVAAVFRLHTVTDIVADFDSSGIALVERQLAAARIVAVERTVRLDLADHSIAVAELLVAPLAGRHTELVVEPLDVPPAELDIPLRLRLSVELLVRRLPQQLVAVRRTAVAADIALVVLVAVDTALDRPVDFRTDSRLAPVAVAAAPGDERNKPLSLRLLEVFATTSKVQPDWLRFAGTQCDRFPCWLRRCAPLPSHKERRVHIVLSGTSQRSSFSKCERSLHGRPRRVAL